MSRNLRLNVLIATVTLALGTPCFAADSLGLPTSEDHSLWYRMYAAGEQCNEKHDTDSAQRYWSAALETLEKDPHPAKKDDIFFAVKLSALEQRFTESYPKNWDDYKGSDASKEARQLQQVETLRRIAALNSRLIQPDNPLATMSRQRYAVALASHKSDKTNTRLAQTADTPMLAAKGYPSPSHVHSYAWSNNKLAAH